jgi:hypothetical protein
MGYKLGSLMEAQEIAVQQQASGKHLSSQARAMAQLVLQQSDTFKDNKNGFTNISE